MTSPAAPDVRRPGRPRDERVDRAIIDSTLTMLVDDGYHALSVEAVAAKAGVGKTTIYRRWPGKQELVADALSALNADMPPMPAPGPTPQRVLMLMTHVCTKDPSSLAVRIMPRMLAYRSSHPELYADYVSRVVEPRREQMRQVLRDGIQAGEVRPDIDVELAALALASPLIMKGMVSPDGRLTPEHALALFDIVWRGIRLEPAVPA